MVGMVTTAGIVMIAATVAVVVTRLIKHFQVRMVVQRSAHLKSSGNVVNIQFCFNRSWNLHASFGLCPSGMSAR